MKIFSPVKDYTGVSASVPFCNGVGETEDPHLIEWFKDHGYEVEEVETATVDTSCVEDQMETADEEQAEVPKTKRTRK
jgi:hypothetical protein|nr:MAG TPA: hypothetical protein [Caudoviricetes sp.]